MTDFALIEMQWIRAWGNATRMPVLEGKTLRGGIPIDAAMKAQLDARHR